MDCNRMPFGKHRGKSLDEIPLSYLRWAVGNCDSLTPMLRQAMRERLAESAEPDSRALVPAVADRWYRSLAREFHPDLGGSHDAMKAVNRGRELLLAMMEGDA